MRKSYIRGSKVSIIIAIILFVVSFVFIVASINSFRSLETLYKEGDDFSGDSGYSIIKVVAIEEQNIVDEKLKEGEKFYLVDYERGFIMLKATEKELEKFLDGRKLQDGKTLVTDNHNYIVDLHLGYGFNIDEVKNKLADIVGVVEHGLFLNMCDLCISGTPNGAVVIENPNKK